MPKGSGRLDSSRENPYLVNQHIENSLNVLQKSNYDAEISDIDLEFKAEEDEDRSKLLELNFKDGEGFVGKSPFPHWTINRQMYQSQMNSLQHERPNDAKRFHKENIRDQITKSLDSEALFSWMVNYNPMMTACGLQWDSKTIKEVVFYQNQQIVTASDSSIAFSNNKLSQYSYRSSTDQM